MNDSTQLKSMNIMKVHKPVGKVNREQVDIGLPGAMDIAEEYGRLIRPISIASKLISIWPVEPRSTNSQRKRLSLASQSRMIYTIVLLFVVGTMAVTVIADVVVHWGDMNEATECALCGSAFSLCFLRLIVYTIHREELDNVIDTMKTDWLECSPDDRTVLKNQCTLAFGLAKQFIVTVALTITVFIVVPTLEIMVFESQDRILPFRGYFFHNQTSHPIFPFIYVFNLIGGAIGGCTIAAATAINFVLVIHGAAKFSIVRRRLETLTKNSYDADYINIDCIRRHQDAIGFADSLENIINVLALGQFCISSGLVCFAGFQITSMMQDKGRLLKYTSFLNSAILELLLFSYSGNVLLSESEAVGDSSYKSDWIGSKFTKNIQILMLRSTVPNKITAAKFYDMSLQSFTSVLSTSFSYFTLLTTIET